MLPNTLKTISTITIIRVGEMIWWCIHWKKASKMDNEERSALLAKAIESKLKERGISRMEFAGLMNVQPSNITKWLSGKHNFTIHTLFEIEKVLQFTIFNLTTKESSEEWSWYIKRNIKNKNKKKLTCASSASSACTQ